MTLEEHGRGRIRHARVSLFSRPRTESTSRDGRYLLKFISVVPVEELLEHRSLLNGVARLWSGRTRVFLRRRHRRGRREVRELAHDCRVDRVLLDEFTHETELLLFGFSLLTLAFLVIRLLCRLLVMWRER